MGGIRPAAEEIARLHHSLFPEADGSYILRLLSEIEGMFKGQFLNFQPMDTAYHDLEHTLQATLCWVHLFISRHASGALPAFDAHDFHVGLVAILMHDLGYLKERHDDFGTGAKYTFVHERRSCEIAHICLEEKGWSRRDIFVVSHLISCTGPRAIIDAIPFYSRRDKVLGQMVCTADYLGQMSDPRYVDKLPALWREFEESDNFREIPLENRLFKSFRQMLVGTPSFWQSVVLPKLDQDCGAVYRYLAEPYPDGPNPYIAQVETNIARIAALSDEQVNEFERQAYSDPET